MNLAAVILAGGKGRRLGGAIKANIDFDGQSLLRRVTKALGDHPSPVIVAHGPIDVEMLDLMRRHVAVPDLDTDYGGPLAGLAAAVDYCVRATSQPLAIVSVAVDTPRIPSDFVSRLIAATRPYAPALLVRYDGQDYPTNGIWHLDAIRDLPLQLRAGTAPRSLRALAAGIGAGTLEWPHAASGDPFVSINTPADLAALGAHVTRPATG